METPDPQAATFYRGALQAFRAEGIRFLVGGAYAMERYTGIARHTKDFDIFLRPRDIERARAVFGALGYPTEIPFPHWLGKAFGGDGESYIDFIWSSGNGVATVDEGWFAHSVEDEVLGLPVRLVPAEEMIWSKAFVMERERYDGADIAHILRARGSALDWKRLLARFGANWRVLLSHLVLFGFVYPCESDRVPRWVLRELAGRLEDETAAVSSTGKICQGTLLSRAQYRVDVEQWGYEDPRVAPAGNMTSHETRIWTAATDEAA
jgi:hypothetical protein